MRISTETLSLRFAPVSEWVLGIRSLSMTILLNHLPQDIQILHFYGLPGLLSHSVFWDIFLMRPNFPILQCLQLEDLLSKFSPRSTHAFKKNLVILSYQTGGFLLVLLLRLGGIPQCSE